MYSFTASSNEFVPERTVQLADGSECKLEYLEPSSRRISTFKNIDYCPRNFDEIRESRHYEGCIRALNGSNEAQIHLYKGDKEFGMVAQRLFLTPESWSKWYYKLLVMAVLMAAPVGMILGSINFSTGAIISKGLMGAGIVIGVLMAGIQLGFYKLFSLLNAPFMRAFGY